MKEVKTNAPIVRTFGEYLPEPFVDASTEDTTYYGWAPIGTSEDENGWRIMRKKTESGVTKCEYAQGTMEFVSAWSERENYTYSR